MHETLIVEQLMLHGQVNEDIVCITGDNYQRMTNTVVSVSAKDTTKDTVHIVFTSFIKTDDVKPVTSNTLTRTALDNTIATDVYHKTYCVNVQGQLQCDIFNDQPLDDGTLPLLVKIVCPKFMSKDKYYHRRHFKTIDRQSNSTHTHTQ